MPKSGYITASRFKDVMTNGRGKDSFGATATTYALEVILSGHGIEKPETNAPSLEWGKENEYIAIKRYEEEQFISVQPSQWIEHPDISGVGGTPDGFVDSDGIIEVKCPHNPVNHYLNWKSAEQYADYMYQIQGYLWMSGRKWCDFVSYYPTPVGCIIPDLVIHRIERDEAVIADLEARIIKFKELIESLR